MPGVVASVDGGSKFFLIEKFNSFFEKAKLLEIIIPLSWQYKSKKVLCEGFKFMNNLLSRIVIDPKVMAGQPVIKGTRLTVPFILGLMSQGISIDDILKEYYRLSKEDIYACLAFAPKH